MVLQNKQDPFRNRDLLVWMVQASETINSVSQRPLPWTIGRSCFHGNIQSLSRSIYLALTMRQPGIVERVIKTGHLGSSPALPPASRVTMGKFLSLWVMVALSMNRVVTPTSFRSLWEISEKTWIKGTVFSLAHYKRWLLLLLLRGAGRQLTGAFNKPFTLSGPLSVYESVRLAVKLLQVLVPPGPYLLCFITLYPEAHTSSWSPFETFHQEGTE